MFNKEVGAFVFFEFRVPVQFSVGLYLIDFGNRFNSSLKCLYFPNLIVNLMVAHEFLHIPRLN